MRALTIKAVYAELIACDLKDVENRSKRWPSTLPLPCTIELHAGKKDGREQGHELEDILTPEQLDQLTPKIRAALDRSRLTYGAVIGRIEIVGCVQDSSSAWALPEMYHWIIGEVERYPEPIPYRGQLGLWERKKIKYACI